MCLPPTVNLPGITSFDNLMFRRFNMVHSTFARKEAALQQRAADAEAAAARWQAAADDAAAARAEAEQAVADACRCRTWCAAVCDLLRSCEFVLRRMQLWHASSVSRVMSFKDKELFVCFDDLVNLIFVIRFLKLKETFQTRGRKQLNGLAQVQ